MGDLGLMSADVLLHKVYTVYGRCVEISVCDMGILTSWKQEKGTDLEYICRGCGEPFGVEYYICPECGGYSVERSQAGQSVDFDNHSKTWEGRLVEELKRRLTIDRSFTESNTARVRR